MRDLPLRLVFFLFGLVCGYAISSDKVYFVEDHRPGRSIVEQVIEELRK